ncbi:MAG: Gfo/Idh/MocA family protein, partial [Phycisphaerae bacterium]
MSRRKPLQAVLVGLGNIAWRFGSDTGGDPLSHAAAFRQNPHTKLAGGCSPDPDDRAAFAEHFDLPAEESLEDLLGRAKPDVVSICSPQEHHFAQVMQCLEAGVKRIWLEKPPASSADEV